MDNRCADRKPLLMNVQVTCPNLGILFGQTANVSKGGMFVENHAVVVPKFSQVSVTFQPDDDELTRTCEARGVVTHQGIRGFGIAFEPLTMDCDCQRSLDAMISA